jgi:hypothetical protein
VNQEDSDYGEEVTEVHQLGDSDSIWNHDDIGVVEIVSYLVTGFECHCLSIWNLSVHDRVKAVLDFLSSDVEQTRQPQVWHSMLNLTKVDIALVVPKSL